MNNSTLDVINAHRSIRAYKPDPVPDEMVELIVAAGQRASTSSNMQLTTAIAVKDPAKRTRIAELCGDQEQIRQAPIFIAWCADRHRLDLACAQQGYTQNTDYLETFLVAAVDVGIFMQTATIAAESLGLGMCYIGAIRNHPRQIIELLGLPSHVFPISGMVLGWPDADPILRPRLGLNAVLHWERYDTEKLGPELQRYDRAMAETGIYGGRQVQTAAGQTAMENYGWLEHSARRVATAGRQELRPVVEDQGWALQ
ncbi:MAG: NADPH-dependent oxidoreductase [Caldilineaceae bacterium]